MHQSTLSAPKRQGKLGAPTHGRLRLLPVVADLGARLGAGARRARRRGERLALRDRRAAAGCSCRRRSLFLVFMGLQGRYFGRWLLPIFPILCLLAASSRCGSPRRAPGAGVARTRAGAACGARARRPRRVVALLRAGARLQRPLGPRALARRHARATRAWMVAHVPAGTRDRRRADRARRVGARRWRRATRSLVLARLVAAHGAPRRADAGTPVVGIEDYERTLAPALIGYYERDGYCWVVSGSTESGPALADPTAVPRGDRLLPRARRRRATVVFAASPYARGAAPGRVQLRLVASTTTRSPTTRPGP